MRRGGGEAIPSRCPVGLSDFKNPCDCLTHLIQFILIKAFNPGFEPVLGNRTNLVDNSNTRFTPASDWYRDGRMWFGG